MKTFRFLLIVVVLFTTNLLADEIADAKKNLFSRFTDSISQGLEKFIGGEGDNEIQINAGEDYHPEFSIMTVKPLATHPGVDAWFVQLQINNHKIRGQARGTLNTGLGYRKLSENKNTLVGANLFIDYDAKNNARTSLGIEFRASVFEVIGNYYRALSSSQTVGDYTERTLDGAEISIIGEIPFLPWANIVANHYEWQADKNSKDSKGQKISLELTVTQNFIVEGGWDDNNLSGSSNFVKAYFIYPARERTSATTNFIGESAFSSSDMSGELLSKIRRTNKQVIESEGSGVVMARAN